MIKHFEIETEQDRHEEFLYSLWEGGEINLFELEAERQLNGLSTMHIRGNEGISQKVKEQRL